MLKLNIKGWFPYICQQNAQRCSMSLDIWTPLITSDHSLRNKSLRTTSHHFKRQVDYILILLQTLQIVLHKYSILNFCSLFRKFKVLKFMSKLTQLSFFFACFTCTPDSFELVNWGTWHRCQMMLLTMVFERKLFQHRITMAS